MTETEICNEALKLAQFGGLLLAVNAAMALWAWKSPRIRASLLDSSVETSWTGFLFGAVVTFILGVAILWERGCW